MKSLSRIINTVFNEKWLILPSVHQSYVKQLESILEGKMAVPMQADVIDDAITDDAETDAPETINGIRVISVDGTIGKHLSQLETMCGGVDCDSVASQLKQAASDENVSTILLYFNSPGGTTTGVEELGQLVKEVSAKKRCVGYTDTLCCSAAYWLGSQCNEFYCSPSSTVGSIGVYCLVLDETKAMDMEGLKVNVFKAGKYKLSGASFIPMTDEEKAMFQDDVNKCYEQFKAVVKSNRNIADADMEGLTFEGNDAIDKGYADGLINCMDEMIEFLAQG